MKRITVLALLAVGVLLLVSGAGCQPIKAPTPTSVPPTPVQVLPTATPLPLPMATPVPATPVPATPVPTKPVAATPTPLPPAPPAGSIVNFRMSTTDKGGPAMEFPAGTAKVYVVFDYADLTGEDLHVRVYDPTGQVLLDQKQTYKGSGTESIVVAPTTGALPGGSYVTVLYRGPFDSPAQSLTWQVAIPPTAPAVTKKYEAPKLLSPDDKAPFGPGYQPQFGWTSVGTLDKDEYYHITFRVMGIDGKIVRWSGHNTQDTSWLPNERQAETLRPPANETASYFVSWWVAVYKRVSGNPAGDPDQWEGLQISPDSEWRTIEMQPKR
jgi:hypothetical protein